MSDFGRILGSLRSKSEGFFFLEGEFSERNSKYDRNRFRLQDLVFFLMFEWKAPNKAGPGLDVTG